MRFEPKKKVHGGEAASTWRHDLLRDAHDGIWKLVMTIRPSTMASSTTRKRLSEIRSFNGASGGGNTSRTLVRLLAVAAEGL